MKTKKSLKTNYVALVVDESQSISMAGLTKSVTNAVNSVIEAYRESAREHNQPTKLTVIGFASSVRVMVPLQDVAFILPIHALYPSGHTALLDGIGRGVGEIEDFGVRDVDPAWSVLTFTDGEENFSTQYRASTIRDLISTKTATDRWTFAVQVPSQGHKDRLVRAFGFPEDNVSVWETTVVGTERMRVETTQAVHQYTSSRASGASASASFYVKTDLSNVTQKDLNKLDNLYGQFSQWLVTKEVDVKTFVESHGKKFLIGAAYYQLTKRETIQASKQIVIIPKGKKTVYGGREARNLLGLPHNNIIVTPGNHADYDIFVQSTSWNRKLVRGTRLLYDMTHSVDLVPTWSLK